MALRKPDLSELRQRLDHLRTMPDTPFRLREIRGLERALEEAANLPAKTRRSKSPSRASELRDIERAAGDDEERTPAPKKRIENGEEGRRKVILKAPSPEDPRSEESKEHTEERSRRAQIDNIRAAMGNSFHGMD